MDARDAFDRLERSGGGFVVPLLVFTLGMILTVVVCQFFHTLDDRIETRVRELRSHAAGDDFVGVGSIQHGDV